ncbi:TIR domain-containing protein [uncultured Prevotella sp.]|uniref:TIR domain-containing protein n=1 Tax=uncultured Prevotella sp. TaxID=159272 RepID=UPI0025D9F55F|nr:TIR domain-containing protein [uncultured Prevotella sp.]
MARKKTYNIFISYRRTAYDTAKLIAEKLRHAGYHVFFDVDTLTSGKFNEQL